MNDGSPQAKKEEEDTYNFMRGFRETFSRPVRRIRFVGLFDTVNSVPTFEKAWMKRSKFPYTARTSAKVIRHAVSIDERRAKFRQDLVSGGQPQAEDKRNPMIHRYNSDLHTGDAEGLTAAEKQKKVQTEEAETLKAEAEESQAVGDSSSQPVAAESKKTNWLGLSKGAQKQTADASTAAPTNAEDSNAPDQPTDEADPLSPHAFVKNHRRRAFTSLDKRQDIEEVWFSGGHGDIGGGWGREDGENWMLSHLPLLWMVAEAEKAGLRFDPVKVAAKRCHPDGVDDSGQRVPCDTTKQRFMDALEDSYAHGVGHDSLEHGKGASRSTVTMWKTMEYLPFQRMDLQPDGSWKAIRWPLPRGETRDMPSGALVHHSVIKRMQADPNYRPGNLIVGGGGRGCRKAPDKYGMGDWTVAGHEGDPCSEVYRKAYRRPEA